jgi:uncharacterized iron-regulated membrane protein
MDPTANHENARSYVFLDAYSGAILRVTPYAGSSRGVKFHLGMVSLQFGQFGDWFGRLIMLAGTLAVPILAVTGFAMFRQCRRSA